MSYAIKEGSAYDGAPTEIYEFKIGEQIWRYTSGQKDVKRNQKNYLAITIERGEISQTGDFGRQNLAIKIDPQAEFLQDYIGQSPAEIMTVTISRWHLEDNDEVKIWRGRVLNIEWQPGIAELRAEPIYTSLQRTGLRRLYQRNCSHVLYDTACKASRITHRVTGTIAAVTGHTIQVAAAAGHADGFFTGGFIEWGHKGRTERRMIASHAGRDLTLPAAGGGLAVGVNITLCPGCDRTLATCQNKFSNSANYGGFPWIPAKNPFGGAALY